MEALEEVVQTPPETECEICILDASGHVRFAWDKNDPAQVAAAKSKFDELKRTGHLLYSVDPTGKQDGTVMHDFDPAVQRIVANKAMVGG